MTVTYLSISYLPWGNFLVKKLTYKGTKLGRYKLSDNCKTITLRNQKTHNNPDIFASCKVLYRYENIIAIQPTHLIYHYDNYTV